MIVEHCCGYAANNIP